MKNKGLSTVVTSLIIILLVLVAVGIIWIVIMKIISSGTEQVSLGKLTMNLEIKKVEVHDAGIDVQVKRNTGAGELAGIKFIVSDGVDTQIFEMPTTMQELATKRFTLAYTGLVKKVSIAGIFETSSGKEFTGNEIDEFEFSNKEIIKNLGGISWWRFEGNAVDELGGNDGSLEGGVDCSADGKFGKACSFDGDGDYINCGNDTSLDITDSITLGAWVKANAFDGPLENRVGVIYRGKQSDTVQKYKMDFFENGKLYFERFISTGNSTYAMANDVSPTDIWLHIVSVYDGEYTRIYQNGVEIGNNYEGSNYILYERSDIPLQIGVDDWYVYNKYFFNGTIDEPMIFNKALSEKQVKALYELDLS